MLKAWKHLSIFFKKKNSRGDQPFDLLSQENWVASSIMYKTNKVSLKCIS